MNDQPHDFRDEFLKTMVALQELNACMTSIGLGGHHIMNELRSVVMNHGADTYTDSFSDRETSDG